MPDEEFRDVSDVLVGAESQPTVEEKLAVFREAYGLPNDAKASDVIQHLVKTTGHSVTLLNLIIVAHTLGATIDLYITDNEEVEPTQVQ